MKKIKFLLLPFCFLLMTVSTYAEELEYFKGSYDQLLEKAANEDKFVLMKFTAVWCGPCKWMDKTTLKDEGVIKMINENFVFYEVDVDQPKHEKLVEAQKLRGVPAFIIMNAKKEKVLFKELGAYGVDEFIDLLSDYL